jgi:hypothetical protein
MGKAVEWERLPATVGIGLGSTATTFGEEFAEGTRRQLDEEDVDPSEGQKEEVGEEEEDEEDDDVASKARSVAVEVGATEDGDDDDADADGDNERELLGTEGNSNEGPALEEHSAPALC